jgi:hypothetical protein
LEQVDEGLGDVIPFALALEGVISQANLLTLGLGIVVEVFLELKLVGVLGHGDLDGAP